MTKEIRELHPRGERKKDRREKKQPSEAGRECPSAGRHQEAEVFSLIPPELRRSEGLEKRPSGFGFGETQP